MRRLRKRWWIVLLAIAVILPIAWLQLRPQEPSDRVKELLGPEAIAILSDADSVQVFRIDGHTGEGEALLKPGPRFRGYLVIGQGEDQGQEFASDLAAVLFKDKTYFNEKSKCFWPGVGYRVWKREQKIDVLICFHCDNVSVTAGREEPEKYHWASGNFGNRDEPEKCQWKSGTFDNSTSRRLLVKLAKRAFPNDPEIVELKEKKHYVTGAREEGCSRARVVHEG